MEPTNPLLAELNGLANVTLTQPDADKFPAEPREPKDPFDVTPPADARSEIAKANAKHAVKIPGGKGYLVVVAGEYYATSVDTKGKVAKRYELAFNLPHLEGALGTIVGKLLLPALKKRYPGTLGYRTHEIVKAEPLTPDTPPTNSLQFMDRARLERYIADNGVPIIPAEYPDVVALREAVMDHKVNPKDFEKREARKQAERKNMAELMAMNPDLADLAEVV